MTRAVILLIGHGLRHHGGRRVLRPCPPIIVPGYKVLTGKPMLRTGPWIWGRLVMGPAGTRIKISTGAKRGNRQGTRSGRLARGRIRQSAYQSRSRSSKPAPGTNGIFTQRLPLPRVKEATANAQADPAGYGPGPVAGEFDTPIPRPGSVHSRWSRARWRGWRRFAAATAGLAFYWQRRSQPPQRRNPALSPRAGVQVSSGTLQEREGS